jgi:hypothetical protein
VYTLGFIYGLKNGSVWVGDASSTPDPRTLLGMGLDPSPSITDGHNGTGMGLYPSPYKADGHMMSHCVCGGVNYMFQNQVRQSRLVQWAPSAT